MKSLKIFFVFVIIFFVEIHNYAQTNVTKVRDEFVYENDDKVHNESNDDLYYKTEKRKLVCKLFDKIDLLTNDSASFIKLQFSDENRKGNNGYLFLSNENELNSFIFYLSTAVEKLSHGDNFQSQSGKYRLDITVSILGKTTIKTINVHETMSGNAYISLNEEGALQLLDWLKSLKL